MTLLAQTSSTAATTRALANWARNAQALRATQPALVESLELTADPQVEWVFGRDGALTARTNQGTWWSGCSLPRRAAMAQLKRLQLAGSVACFLLPPHAAAVAVALEKLLEEQAIIALLADRSELKFLLYCHDFSNDIASHRAWFVAGTDWPQSLDRLFEDQAGLSIPTQFIRLTSTDPERVEQSIASAQKVFSDVTARRARHMQVVRDGWQTASCSPPRRLCVVAASRFRLWNDWGATLRDACAGDPDCLLVDPDDPACASPLLIVQRAAACDAIVTIDTSRADAPGVLPDAMPWATWSTNGRIPARSSAGPQDRLVVLDQRDRDRATSAGWAPDELSSAWPQVAAQPPGAPGFIGIIADTFPLDPPESIDDYSSHRPLWEYIADELVRNPFALSDDADAYLSSRMRKFDVGEQTVNRAMFESKLIGPAYEQGLARALMEAGVPVHLAGKGWDQIERFSGSASGAVSARGALSAAVARSSVLLHVWPGGRVHAIDFAGRPVVRPGRSRDALLREIRAALRDPASAQRAAPVGEKAVNSFISPGFLRQLLGRVR